MEKGSAKRGWIKNVAIIFLIVLLLLTFFSNTILSHSLPEVSAQYPQYASISSSVKLNGTVKANESYKVIYEAGGEETIVQSRRVRSVYVKEGDYVEADQDILALEGGMSAELEALQKEYDALKKTYDLGLSSDNVGYLQTSKSLAEAQTRYNEAKEELEKLKAGAGGAISAAATPEEKAKRAEEFKKNKRQLEDRIDELEKNISSLEGKISLANGKIDGSVSGNLADAQREYNQIKNRYDSLAAEEKRLGDRKTALEKSLKTMREANGLYNEYNSLLQQSYTTPSMTEDGAFNPEYYSIMEKISEVQSKLVILGYSNGNYTGISDVNVFEAEHELENLTDQYTEAAAALSEYAETYNAAKAKADALKDNETASGEIAEYEAMLKVYTEQKKELEKELEGMTDPDDLESQIKAAEANVKALESDLNILRAQTSQSNQSTQLDRQEQKKQLDEMAAKIEKYKNAPETLAVKAPKAGRVVSIYPVVGDRVSSGDTVANIEIADKGYKCEITVPSDQAKKITVSSPVSVSNSWWYSNIEAKITQIRSDVQSQGKNRIIILEVTGDAYEGQEVTFVIGDKSSSYSSVLPNSAIREDNQGKFVLVVDSKSTPIGTKYTARRVEIEVVASDDTSSAVSGLMGGEFVITNATAPISDKQRVRLPEN